LVPDGAARDHHYDLLGHYSYRLFLRDVLKQRDDLRPARLERYVGPPVAARYLRFLVDAGLVRRAGRGVYRLCDDRIVSFGGTLEWYVAQVLTREFECASAHGLRIAHAAHGGDYDVIACTEGEVVYVETKSAPSLAPRRAPRASACRKRSATARIMAPSTASAWPASPARRSIACVSLASAAPRSPRSRAASPSRRCRSTSPTPGAAAGPRTIFSSPRREKSASSASGKSIRCECCGLSGIHGAG